MGVEVNKGQLRPDVFPELMGLSEAVAAGGRTARSAMSHYKGLPDFPGAIAELDCGPVYLAQEIRAFWAKHPMQKRLSAEEKKRITEIATDPGDDAMIGQLFGVSAQTIANIRRAENKRSQATEQ